jgi:hypothetical protein
VRPLAPLLLVLLLLGCSETGLRVAPPASWSGELDTWFQERADYADILLVVDDSGSMGDEQEELADSFDALVEFIERAETHYHIGVVTTDVDTGFDGGGDVAGLLRGDPHFITPDTPDAAAVFQDAIRVGTQGSGFERGLEAARAALDPDRLDGSNEGFYRDEALLVLLFVSDEDDQSLDAVGTYLQHFRNLKGGDEGAVLAHGLIGLDEDSWEPGPCGAGDPYEGGAVPAYRYFDFIEATGGIAAPVCDGGFDRILLEMGQATTRIRDRFPLSLAPVPQSVTLTLAVPGTPDFISGGFEVPGSGLDERWPWELERDLDGWWLRFTDPESLPPPNTRIQAAYQADW